MSTSRLRLRGPRELGRFPRPALSRGARRRGSTTAHAEPPKKTCDRKDPAGGTNRRTLRCGCRLAACKAQKGGLRVLLFSLRPEGRASFGWGGKKEEEEVPEAERPADLFYIHPSDYYGLQWNAPLHHPPADEQVRGRLRMRARGCRSLLAKCSPSKVGQRVVARCKNERWSFERVYSAGSVLDAPPGRVFQRGAP